MSASQEPRSLEDFVLTLREVEQDEDFKPPRYATPWVGSCEDSDWKFWEVLKRKTLLLECHIDFEKSLMVVSNLSTSHTRGTVRYTEMRASELIAATWATVTEDISTLRYLTYETIINLHTRRAIFREFRAQGKKLWENGNVEVRPESDSWAKHLRANPLFAVAAKLPRYLSSGVHAVELKRVIFLINSNVEGDEDADIDTDESESSQKDLLGMIDAQMVFEYGPVEDAMAVDDPTEAEEAADLTSAAEATRFESSQLTRNAREIDASDIPGFMEPYIGPMESCNWQGGQVESETKILLLYCVSAEKCVLCINVVKLTSGAGAGSRRLTEMRAHDMYADSYRAAAGDGSSLRWLTYFAVKNTPTHRKIFEEFRLQRKSFRRRIGHVEVTPDSASWSGHVSANPLVKSAIKLASTLSTDERSLEVKRLLFLAWPIPALDNPDQVDPDENSDPDDSERDPTENDDIEIEAEIMTHVLVEYKIKDHNAPAEPGAKESKGKAAVHPHKAATKITAKAAKMEDRGRIRKSEIKRGARKSKDGKATEHFTDNSTESTEPKEVTNHSISHPSDPSTTPPSPSGIASPQLSRSSGDQSNELFKGFTWAPNSPGTRTTTSARSSSGSVSPRNRSTKARSSSVDSETGSTQGTMFSSGLSAASHAGLQEQDALGPSLEVRGDEATPVEDALTTTATGPRPYPLHIEAELRLSQRRAYWRKHKVLMEGLKAMIEAWPSYLEHMNIEICDLDHRWTAAFGNPWLPSDADQWEEDYLDDEEEYIDPEKWFENLDSYKTANSKEKCVEEEQVVGTGRQILTEEEVSQKLSDHFKDMEVYHYDDEKWFEDFDKLRLELANCKKANSKEKYVEEGQLLGAGRQILEEEEH